MARDIVILLDGTANQISKKRTNILRLYGTLEKTAQQAVFYDPGVGTFARDQEAFGIFRQISEVWGQATGQGMSENILEAYQFICDHYEPPAADTEGSRIWLFGFSRGAYSARVLAGFLRAFGLIAPEQGNLLRYAWRAYRTIGQARLAEEWSEGGGAFAEMRLHERVMQPVKPPIRCLALFDTVASVFEPGRYFGYRKRRELHAHASNNPAVQAVRHAVSIDDRRAMFRPRLWGEERLYAPDPEHPEDAVPQDVREVWFAGVHGDVGGGYPEAESALGKLSLDWLITETAAMGLAYDAELVERLVRGGDPETSHMPPSATGPMHESMTWLWKLFEYVPGRTPPGQPVQGREVCGLTFPLRACRIIPQGAEISPHVRVRWEDDPTYRPPNLPPWPETDADGRGAEAPGR